VGGKEKKSNWNGKRFSNYEVATILVKAKSLDLTAPTPDLRSHIMKAVLIPTDATGH
jgi:hypothetical protein